MQYAFGNCRATFKFIGAPRLIPGRTDRATTALLPEFDHLQQVCTQPGLKTVNRDGTVVGGDRTMTKAGNLVEPEMVDASTLNYVDAKAYAKQAALAHPDSTNFSIGGALVGGLTGLLSGGPAGALVGAVTGGVGGGGGAAAGGGTYTPPIAVAQPTMLTNPCRQGYTMVGGKCVKPTAALPGGEPLYYTPTSGRGPGGRPAVEPIAIQSITRLKCPPGYVLGRDDRCYWGLPRNSRWRKWRPGRKPKFTGGDLNAIRKAKGLAETAEELFLATNPRKKAVNR